MVRRFTTIVVALGLTSCRPAPRWPIYPLPPPAPAPRLFTPPARLPFERLGAPVHDDDPALRALLPAVPAWVNPGRPLSGGEALRLADLAMTRGDPQDAAAQYRALLGDRRAEVASYVRWRLALAYMALARPEDAQALVEEVAGPSSPVAWAALLALAELLDARGGTFTALSTLRRRAGPRADELEAWLIRHGHGAGRVNLMLGRAAQASTIEESCGLALAAFALDRGAALDDTVQRCYDLFAGGGLATHAPRVAEAARRLPLAEPQLALLDEADRAWHELDGESLGRLAPRRWAEVARVYVVAHDLAPYSPAGNIASWCAVAALDNARRLTAHHSARFAVDPELADRSRRISDESRRIHGPGTISICADARAETLARAPADDAAAPAD